MERPCCHKRDMTPKLAQTTPASIILPVTALAMFVRGLQPPPANRSGTFARCLPAARYVHRAQLSQLLNPGIELVMRVHPEVLRSFLSACKVYQSHAAL